MQSLATKPLRLSAPLAAGRACCRRARTSNNRLAAVLVHSPAAVARHLAGAQPGASSVPSPSAQRAGVKAMAATAHIDGKDVEIATLALG